MMARMISLRMVMKYLIVVLVCKGSAFFAMMQILFLRICFRLIDMRVAVGVVAICDGMFCFCKQRFCENCPAESR